MFEIQFTFFLDMKTISVEINVQRTRMRCYIDIWCAEFDTYFKEKCCTRDTDSKRKMDSIFVS